MQRGERWMQRAELVIVAVIAIVLLIAYVISRFIGS
jgi:flagellar biogenesis protein FliO